jgi:hypothetical protein
MNKRIKEKKKKKKKNINKNIKEISKIKLL